MGVLVVVGAQEARRGRGRPWGARQYLTPQASSLKSVVRVRVRVRVKRACGAVRPFCIAAMFPRRTFYVPRPTSHVNVDVNALRFTVHTNPRNEFTWGFSWLWGRRKRGGVGEHQGQQESHPSALDSRPFFDSDSDPDPDTVTGGDNLRPQALFESEAGLEKDRVDREAALGRFFQGIDPAVMYNARPARKAAAHYEVTA